MQEKIKKLGIWMDNSMACVMEYTKGDIKTHSIKSDFDHEDREFRLNKSENVMHNKEQHDQVAYYKKLAEVIRHYNEVVLFGPTNAKAELFNILKNNTDFSKIIIELKPADKMTENQQHAFVKDHFSTSHSHH